MAINAHNLNLLLLNIGLAIHNADWNWKGINSPFTRLYYIREGSANIVFNDRTQVLKPGHLYLIPAFMHHSYECNSYFSLNYIHIYEEQTSDISILELLQFPTEIQANSLDSLLVNRLLEINPGRELKQYDPRIYDNQPTLLKNIAENTHQEYYTNIETKGILMQLFSRFLKNATQKTGETDSRILKSLSFIRKNIDKPIKINWLSEICLLSEDHFIRLFKKEINCTPIQYINQKKIEKAQLKLIIEDSSIKDIAYSLSFNNLSYFNKLFKETTNITPLHYRKIQREKI